MSEDQPSVEEMLGVDPQTMVGKRIIEIDHEPKDYDRIKVLKFSFDDGSSIAVSYWTTDSADDSLELRVPSA